MADPERLGKYEIRSVLGKGAMGVVYKAFDPQIERSVAIKTIRKDMVDPHLAAQYMARFKNEAKAAGRLHHPNIVGIYEFGEEDAIAYIAMEYVEGVGLREYIATRTNFDFGQLVALMTQLLNGLQFAHGNNVVHRDIKPTNLIVTRQAALKIADFGIARVDTSNLTTVGSVIGTPSYMSPEQCRGREADSRSDLFSAGVVLYELLTGQKPFHGTVETIAYKICHEEPALPSKLSALRLPAAVDELVAKALAKDPAARFQSAQAFHDALRDVAGMTVEVDEGLGTTIVNIQTVMLQKPAAHWDDETLATAEHELARALGPMAKMIVRKVAAQTQDREELCSLLSENIVDPDSRRKFVDAFHRAGSRSGIRSDKLSASSAKGSAHGTARERAATRGGTGVSGSVMSAATTAPLDQAYVDALTARLTSYMGPIAKIVAKRAAREVTNRHDFARKVAENLAMHDRIAFLQECGYFEKP